MVPDWLVYVLLGLLCAGALVALVCWLVSFFRKSPAERKEIVIQFLMGLVTVAEDAVKENGAGAVRFGHRGDRRQPCPRTSACGAFDKHKG